MLPVSLDCRFLIAPSVFSNVYVKEAGTTYHSPVPKCIPGVLLVLVFRIVFFVVVVLYIFILCLVPNVASVSGLIILYCPSVSSNVYLTFFSKRNEKQNLD